MPVFRQHVYDTITQSRDRLGRKNPTLAFNFATMMRSIPGWESRWSRIPDEFWSDDVTPDGFLVATVSCPCGATPAVEAGRMTPCDCQRIFFFTAKAILVANSPKQEIPTSPLSPEEATALSELEPVTPAAS